MSTLTLQGRGRNMFGRNMRRRRLVEGQCLHRARVRGRIRRGRSAALDVSMTTRFATTGIAATLLLAAVFLGIDWMTGNVLAAFVAELAVGAALLWDSR